VAVLCQRRSSSLECHLCGQFFVPLKQAVLSPACTSISMSDREYRSHSSRSASQDTTENLYNLALLRRPKKTSFSSGTGRSFRSINGETTHAQSLDRCTFENHQLSYLTTMTDLCLGRLSRSFEYSRSPTRPVWATIRNVDPQQRKQKFYFFKKEQGGMVDRSSSC
jgi:hypothetical protein